MGKRRKSKSQVIVKSAWVRTWRGRALMVQKHNDDMWINAGGKRDKGESLVTTFIREVFEELRVRIIRSTVKKLFTLRAQTKDGRRLISHYFAGEYRGRLRPNNEIARHAWITLGDGAKKTPMTKLYLRRLLQEGMIERA